MLLGDSFCKLSRSFIKSIFKSFELDFQVVEKLNLKIMFHTLCKEESTCSMNAYLKPILAILATCPSVSSKGSSDEYALHNFIDKSGRTQMSFSSTGNANFRGAISSTGESSFHNILAKDGITSKGSISGRTIKASESMSASSLTLQSRLVADSAQVSNLISTNELAVTSEMKVNGIVNITGDMTIKGKVNVGSLATKGKIEATTVKGKNIKSQELENTGMIKANAIVTDNIDVHGEVKATTADFKGNVTMKSIMINRGKLKSLSVISSSDMRGSFNCDGRATFRDKMLTLGQVTMKGPVSFLDELEASRISIKGLSKQKPKLDVIDGGIYAHEIESKTFVKADNIVVNDLTVKTKITSKNIDVISNARMRSIDITNTASMNVIHAKEINIDSDIIFKNGAIKAEGQISTTADCSIGGSVFAKRGKFLETLTTENIEAKGKMSAYEISCKGDIITSRNLKADFLHIHSANVTGVLRSNRIEIGVINTSQIESSAIIANSSIVSRGSFATAKANITEATVTNSLYAQSGIISGGPISVNGRMAAGEIR